jgi:hypothetical protein
MSDNLFGLAAAVAHSVFATKIGGGAKRTGHAVGLLPATQCQPFGNAVVAKGERGVLRQESVYALSYHWHRADSPSFSPPAICAHRA